MTVSPQGPGPGPESDRTATLLDFPYPKRQRGSSSRVQTVLRPSPLSTRHTLPNSIAARHGLAAPHRHSAPPSLFVSGYRGNRRGRRHRGGPGPGGARAGAGPRLRPPQRLLPQPRPRPRLLRRHVARAPRLLREARAAHRSRRRRARRRRRQARRAYCAELRCVEDGLDLAP